MNFVTSLDGAVTIDGRSAGLGSPGDKRIFDLLRALADVVLVGSGTAAVEGYGPMSKNSPVGALRASLGRPASGLVTAAVSPTILVTCEAADAARRAALAEAGVTVLVCGGDDVDVSASLDALADLGYEQVLSADSRRLGVGRRMVAAARDGARTAGCEWLHVDFDPPLIPFYVDACGFRPTSAGLMAL